ncbi:MAG: DUF1015 family protein [Deltaproteobacteria bacterium]|nr:DUF1015 family protein [Deltaproteobacteria bacterium]
MAVVRPFRGVRAVPARVDPGALSAPSVDVDDDAAAALLARDPRNVIGLLKVGEEVRAKFLLKEQLRAGVVARDELPALYVLKVAGTSSDDGGARIGFFAVVRADSVEVDGAPADAARGEQLRGTGVAIEPVVVSYVDKKGRVARSLESETEREPDAAFELQGRPCELWAVDDDSAAARVTALVEGQTLKVTSGARALSAQRSFSQGSKGNDDDAGAFALAFFVDEESPVDLVPVGVVLHSLEGTL